MAGPSGMTKAKKAVIRFVEIGGSVSECGKIVIGPSGFELKQRIRGKYLSVSAHLPESKHRHPINIHQIAAYVKYGKDFILSDVVRHKDGNPLNNSSGNILIGTQSQNMMDRAREDRRIHAQHAASFQKASVSNDVIDKIKEDHALGLGYKKLKKKYGFSVAFFSYHLSKTAKRTKFHAPDRLGDGTVGLPRNG